MTTDEIAGIIAALRTNDWSAVYPAVDERIVGGDIAWLRRLFEAIEADHDAVGASGVRDIRHRVEQALALHPGVEWARAAIELARIAHRGSAEDVNERLMRRVSPLSAAQGDDVLAAIEAEQGEDPALLGFFGEWLHSRVARGADVRSSESARRIQERLARAAHPFARLPLVLLPCEEQLPSRMEQYRIGPAERVATMATEPREPEPPPTSVWPSWQRGAIDEVTTPDERERITSVIVPGSSNWKTEARVFSVENAPSEIGPDLLAALGLECISGPPSCQRVALGEVVRDLFSYGAYGGFYGPRRGPGHGRLAMWRSVAGLLGVGEPFDIVTVAAVAESVAWTLFDPEFGWFEDVGANISFALRRPGSNIVAVFAATDID